MKESFLTHVAKKYWLLGTINGHMQKFGLKSQKLLEISGYLGYLVSKLTVHEWRFLFLSIVVRRL